MTDIIFARSDRPADRELGLDFIDLIRLLQQRRAPHRQVEGTTTMWNAHWALLDGFVISRDSGEGESGVNWFAACGALTIEFLHAVQTSVSQGGNGRGSSFGLVPPFDPLLAWQMTNRRAILDARLARLDEVREPGDVPLMLTFLDDERGRSLPAADDPLPNELVVTEIFSPEPYDHVQGFYQRLEVAPLTGSYRASDGYIHIDLLPRCPNAGEGREVVNGRLVEITADLCRECFPLFRAFLDDLADAANMNRSSEEDCMLNYTVGVRRGEGGPTTEVLRFVARPWFVRSESTYHQRNGPMVFVPDGTVLQTAMIPCGAALAVRRLLAAMEGGTSRMPVTVG